MHESNIRPLPPGNVFVDRGWLTSELGLGDVGKDLAGLGLDQQYNFRFRVVNSAGTIWTVTGHSFTMKLLAAAWALDLPGMACLGFTLT